jgi:putative effector of murein hydrolase
VSAVTAVIELLVGAACVALAVALWARRTPTFRVVAICLAIAGLVAVVNAIVTLA